MAADERVAAKLGVRGVVVLGVGRGTPAEQAGLRAFDPRSGQVGDIIVGVGGKPTQTLADFAEALESAGIGKEVTVKVVRGTAERDVTLRVIDVGA